MRPPRDAPNALKFTVQVATMAQGGTREQRLIGRLRGRLRVGGVGRRYTVGACVH